MTGTVVVARQSKIALRVGGAIVVVAVAWLLYDWSNSRPLPFDASAWSATATANTDPDSSRHRMADGLVESRILIGKPKQAVEEMLGPPADTSKFKDYDLVYHLGRERGFMSIDSEWLVVRIGSAGVVSSAEIVRD
jgi:hypothetical protein